MSHSLAVVRGLLATGLTVLYSCCCSAAPLYEAGCARVTFTNVFTPEQFPDRSLDDLLEGRLGVLRPTYDHFFLVLAYRALSGAPTDGRDAQHIVAQSPCGDEYADPHRRRPRLSESVAAWLDARRETLGAAAGSAVVAVDPSIGGSVPDTVPMRENCNADSFRYATTMLQMLRRDRTVKSADLQEWLSGQDTVFAACSRPAEGPADVGDGAPRWLRQQRAYQRAAVAFYSQRYEQAEKQFAALVRSSDPAAGALANYLAARAAVRLSTVGGGGREPLLRAKSRLEALLSNPAHGAVHADARRLLRFVRLRVDSSAVRRELADKLTQTRLYPGAGQDIFDFGVLYEQPVDEADGRPGLALWLQLMRGQSHGAADTWREHRRLPWLLAALEAPREQDLHDVIAAAYEVPRSSSGYLTARYHLVRLEGDPSKAFRVALELLTDRAVGTTAADRNRIREAALRRAQTLDELAQVLEMERAVPIRGSPPHVTKDAADLINEALTLQDLLSLSRSARLSEPFRQELTRMVWVRALALRRWDVLEAVMPSVSEQLPELGTGWTRVARARTDREREAVAAMITMAYPGMAAHVRSVMTHGDSLAEFSTSNMHRTFEQEGSRDNWWCSFRSDDRTPARRGAQRSALFAVSQLDTLQTERNALHQLPDATEHLGPIVMRWAAIAPRDPLLPQALRQLVRSTRGGCYARSDRGLSRKAYRHLHRHFADSQAARLTKHHWGW